MAGPLRAPTSWSCVSSGYTEGARHMFPGRAPILQWGIKKGNAQSFSVEEARTTPHDAGQERTVRAPEARSAAMVVPGQRKTARCAAQHGVRYLAHVNPCRLRGTPRMGRHGGTGGRVGRAVPTTARPRWDSIIAMRPGRTPCRLRETSRCLHQPHAHGLKMRSYRISMPLTTWPAG
jgi:hypothetical protein